MSKKEILKVIHEENVLGNVIRCYGTLNEPLFVARDIAEWIQYNKTNNKYNVSKMIRSIDKEDKLVGKIFLPGQNQTRNVRLLTEFGLYEVLMLSTKPIAKQLKKEIKRILKDIRQFGIAVDNNRIKNDIELSDAYRSLMSERNLLAEERNRLQEERDNLEELRNSEAHMRVYYNVNIQDRGTIDIGQVAALLERPGFGRNNLYRFLRSAHILMNNNRPYQRYVGPFQYVRAASYNTSEGAHASYKPVVTQRGLDLIIRRLIDYGFINEEPANTNIESFLESQEEASSSD